MNQITYKIEDNFIAVFLTKKYVGDIHKVENGYAYYPKGSKLRGDIFPTFNEVKRSLEED